ncbi:RNA polymerase sigma factor [Polymorphum gilvum SL003B-26A1]|uniref:RNA polymerase sigma factor n=2 Tax=Polymorphum TaxID=991903 RepID=F2J622_POLGS|nr:RNA polymerase sigma factor [Polymorphum gilvum SL003B-26A1]
MRSASDDDLLQFIGLGDEDAFRILVERHVDRGYAVAFRILRNPTDAEDVVQDAFLQLWTRRTAWQPGRARFSTWLYRVVTNRCIDLLRRPRVEAMDDLPEVPAGGADQVQTMMQEEVTALLNAAMAQLAGQQRIALILSYHENLSNGEIAEIMETSVFAVESLLKRGRQKLRQLLRNKGDEITTLFTND